MKSKSEKGAQTKAPDTAKADDVPHVIRFGLHRVEIGAGRREHDEDAIKDMAVSMREVGMVSPITIVRTGTDDEGVKKYALVDGLLRLKAAELLGWKKIDAIAIKTGKVDTRLAEIAANLFREDLTELQRADLVNEWIEIVGKKAAQVAQPGGRQPNDKGISAAARSLNLSRRMVARCSAISELSLPAREAVKNAKLDDDQGALLEIAREERPEDQTKKTEEIARRKTGKKTSHKGLSLPEVDSPNTADAEVENSERIDSSDADYQSLMTAWKNSPVFAAAWNAAKLPARERFIKRVLRSSADANAAPSSGSVRHE